MIVFPNCKINVGLDILRRRPDGYHDLATVMVPVPWHEVLEVVPVTARPDGQVTLTVSGRTVDCPVEKNLVVKAYRALERAGHRLPAVDIYLQKVIPDGAGLGGGSADAAFMLRLLNDLCALGLTDAQLAATAATIGADCPFFIYNRPMLCTGIGDVMQPIDLPLQGLHVHIVKPDVSVPTAQAYAGITPHEPAIALDQRLAMPIEQWQQCVANAFEASVFAQHPVLADIKQQLLAAPGTLYAAMSGSGSAIYALTIPDSPAPQTPYTTFSGRL